MNIIGQSVIAAAVFALVSDLFGDGLPHGIGRDSIYDDFLVTDSRRRSLATLKRGITRGINTIIAGCNGFKIGKTGVPADRAAAYRSYSRMFLLCRSRSRGVIEVLEAYYNEKYHGAYGNDNSNRGSAGVMANSHGCYYLYIVVR